MVYAALLMVSLLFAGTHQFQFKHHNNDELVQVLQDVNSRCPNVTRLYTLTETSVLGIPLYVIEFSTKPGHHEISK
ncbi:Peptidase M14 domain containing protein [Asbolus verrucosus]|uniref:Peptidase M14 domain containing protein n=1 Tax=Asbolus verrucosus TaxID=1661398 RepID=A0A482VHT3_ASBVE|nr:Peptidase M14 domain containing protein [Asbolus verrucosus]